MAFASEEVGKGVGGRGLWTVPHITGIFCILFVAELKNFNIVFLVIILCEWVSLTCISVHLLYASQTRVIYMVGNHNVVAGN